MTTYINTNSSHIKTQIDDIKYGHCFEIDGKVYKKIQPCSIDSSYITTGTGIPYCSGYYNKHTRPRVSCVIINDTSGAVKMLDGDFLVHEVHDVSIDYNLSKRSENNG